MEMLQLIIIINLLFNLIGCPSGRVHSKIKRNTAYILNCTTKTKQKQKQQQQQLFGIPTGQSYKYIREVEPGTTKDQIKRLARMGLKTQDFWISR